MENSDQLFKRKNPTEIHNYPKKSIIQYSEPGRSYTYKIIEEGYYPPATYLKYTKGQSFRIPDNYEVETSWGKPKKLQTVRCLIKYVEKIQYHVKSEKSSSDAAVLYAKALNPEKKTRYSGPHFFGLYLEVLQQSIEFNIKEKSFHFSIGEENNEETKWKARAAVQVCDKSQITCESYRTLASISQDLPREWKVSAERKEITHEMKEIIPISLVNLEPSLPNDPVNSEIHINNSDVIDNVQQSIGKGGRRDIINILKYLIPGLLKRKVLDITNPIIHLRISGDRRNVRRKVKQVMVTCSILNDIDNLHQPENHYTIVLYPGIEKYETLHIILDPLIVELRKLKEEGLEYDQGKDKARAVIVEEIRYINVKFHFWLEINSTNWQYTSLTGQDKLAILQHFNLAKLLPTSRATQICNLWDNFYLLHKAMKDPKTNASEFSNSAIAWLHQFLDSNYFYQASDITPYMHVLVYHIPEMIRIHHHFDGGNGKERKSAIVNILEHENRLLYFNIHDEIDSIQLPKRLRVK
ncbi:uncharacterized protein OCT59_010063 [Rhizophagus irregularis]|uniref:uncharacterized protein n=1 Tax=Rhizophagus irregularis TaxID=588596 RepID=UPI003329C346|nr:hypothetical protein OCT59_010063 [Rhizophagus irregularis]